MCNILLYYTYESLIELERSKKSIFQQLDRNYKTVTKVRVFRIREIEILLYLFTKNIYFRLPLTHIVWVLLFF